MCSTSTIASHQQVCEDKGNLKENQWDTSPENNPYTAYDTSRLVHSLGEDYCGLTIMVTSPPPPSTLLPPPPSPSPGAPRQRHRGMEVPCARQQP